MIKEIKQMKLIASQTKPSYQGWYAYTGLESIELSKYYYGIGYEKYIWISNKKLKPEDLVIEYSRGTAGLAAILPENIFDLTYKHELKYGRYE